MFFIGDKMKKIKNLNIELKSNKGFTMQDIAIALVIFMIFTGSISAMFYSVYKLNYDTRLTANATYYAMRILEDIDKIAYEEVNESLANSYERDLPNGYQLKLEITPYDPENNATDLIKKVKLTISYTFLNRTEEFVVQRLKIKEL